MAKKGIRGRTAGRHARCDSFSALRRVDEQTSSSWLGRGAEKLKFPVGVGAPSVCQPEVMVRSGAAFSTSRDQVGPSAEVLQRGNFFEEPSNSQSPDSFVHIPGLKEESLDYEEGGDMEEGETVEDVGTIVGNVGGGSLSNGKRSIGDLQKEPLKMVYCDRKCGREETGKRASSTR
ncbi:hypothetical protein NDU88_003733 [Pleurodeles waltl]|uniref:Uncharacterized protein n=1 Tax=Pleurodeles waltl TaxID=8319 RepID=A0AAV7NK55_PLEWA|nr:hypothetical protein NDU88_003733 [Pleurodeles waltl]